MSRSRIISAVLEIVLVMWRVISESPGLMINVPGSYPSSVSRNLIVSFFAFIVKKC